MTEPEWLACDDARPMFRFLREKSSTRKVRLFAVACFRRMWGVITGERSRRAVEVLEEMADGLADEAAMCATFLPEVANFACADGDSNLGKYFLVKDPFPIALTASYLVRHGLPRDEQAGIIRELFGPLPFREVRIDPTWLAWNGGAVRRLAASISEERSLPEGALDPARLAVLADALEDAGCVDAELLEHLRGPGPHVRGCFAVDAIQGKG